MSANDVELLDTLRKIADAANTAINGNNDGSEHEHGHSSASQYESQDNCGCTLKSLPQRLLVEAARTARTVNPVNAPAYLPLAFLPANAPLKPLAIAVMTSKYWGPSPRRLTVSFMETTPADLRTRILSHMNAWATRTSISFVQTSGVGDVRISRGQGGYWSYLGTDILHIPKNRPTMNLQDFSMNTPQGEYLRVVRHETGHTLGFPHEHMRKALVEHIDPQKAYDYFWNTYRWDKTTVDQQVLTSLDERTLMGTAPDQTSIMCYQLPGTITRDGKPILGGIDINQTDYGFAARIYPKTAADTELGVRDTPHAATELDEWDASEDVEVSL
ncbi:M12 family metallopeptidase [Paraburkholderia sp. RCC_158]|uniref:M12 family metallopeptidase n=1 Tax=Paraburkholderia sp. RCC_158 TaxID=3239220 RepID=UPI003525AAAC